MAAPEKNWLSIGWFENDRVLGSEQLPQTVGKDVLVNEGELATLAATEGETDGRGEAIGLL